MSRGSAASIVTLAVLGCERRGATISAPASSAERIQIVTQVPGRTAEEVDRLVSAPISSELASLRAITGIETRSLDGVSVVEVEYRGDAFSVRIALVELLQEASDELPQDVDQPILSAPTHIPPRPAVRYLMHTDGRTARELADWQLLPAIHSVSGVAGTLVCGGASDEYEVELDADRLAAHDVSVGEVIEALSSHATAPGGVIEPSGHAAHLGEDLGSRVVREAEATLLVRDLAQVMRAPEPPRCLAFSGRGEVVSLAVLPALEADPAAVGRAVDERLAAPRGLPPGVKLERLDASVALDVWLPPSVTLEDASRFAAQMARRLGEAPDVESVVVEAGIPDGVFTGAVQQVRVYMALRPGADARALAARLREIPGVVVLSTQARLRIFGDDEAQRRTVARTVERAAAGVVGVEGVVVPDDGRRARTDVRPDRQSLARLGISATEVDELVQVATEGREVGVVIERERRYPIRVRLRASSPDALRRLIVRSAHGTFAPLGSIAEITVDDGPALVTSANRRRFTEVVIGLGERADVVRARVKEIELPAGVELEWVP